MTDKKTSQPLSLRLMRRVVTLPRSTKRLVMLLADGLALPISAAIAVWLVTPQILAALSLLMQEDEDVTATNVDGDSSIENLWAQDPEWAVERLVERLEVLVNEIDEERREER